MNHYPLKNMVEQKLSAFFDAGAQRVMDWIERIFFVPPLPEPGGPITVLARQIGCPHCGAKAIDVERVAPDAKEANATCAFCSRTWIVRLPEPSSKG
jgi:hypothetical protein